MSENIRGITFAEQTVTPADDAIVRRAILGDGILTGCDVTYSGSTLTMAAGYIIACGRAFQVTTAQNWAVVDATSGFARLLLTLDLTKTATEDTFKQIEFSLEYAAAEDGFLDLVQEDINLSGAKYQIVAAVVSLGTGGITGIVSNLERTEGGGGLNFKVVAGLTQPGSATENTIWGKTEKITTWIFSATEPLEPVDWMVWFPTGTNSIVEFNALKKNVLQIYPLGANQYIDGTWKRVPTMIYKNRIWVEWMKYILNKDNLYDGWTKTGGLAFSVTADGVLISVGENYGTIYYNKKCDISNFNTINVEFKNNTTTMQLLVGTQVPSAGVDTEIIVSNSDFSGVLSADIGGLSSYGSVYIGLGPYNRAGGSVLIEGVWFE